MERWCPSLSPWHDDGSLFSLWCQLSVTASRCRKLGWETMMVHRLFGAVAAASITELGKGLQSLAISDASSHLRYRSVSGWHCRLNPFYSLRDMRIERERERKEEIEHTRSASLCLRDPFVGPVLYILTTVSPTPCSYNCITVAIGDVTKTGGRKKSMTLERERDA